LQRTNAYSALEVLRQYAIQIHITLHYIACICASVAQLEAEKKEVEEKNAAVEESRAMQQLLDNAKVSCMSNSRVSLTFLSTVVILVKVQ